MAVLDKLISYLVKYATDRLVGLYELILVFLISESQLV